MKKKNKLNIILCCVCVCLFFRDHPVLYLYTSFFVLLIVCLVVDLILMLFWL